LTEIDIRGNVVPRMCSEHSDRDLCYVVDTILASHVYIWDVGCSIFRDCFDIAIYVQVNGVVEVRAEICEADTVRVDIYDGPGHGFG